MRTRQYHEAVLAKKDNERLTRTGRGTPAGELLRRYWYPVAGVSELDDEPVKAVRLLGEDLALYRDRSGRLGLLGAGCPHRNVSLAYGIPEVEGLRCCYHGWLFDERGRCLEQPAEPPESSFKDRVQHLAYPVRELGGLVWAYLGPEPMPPLPGYDVFAWGDAWRDAAVATLPCNWLQCMENAVDLMHVDYLHGLYYDYVLERAGKPRRGAGDRRFAGKKQVAMAFDRSAFGITKRRLIEGVGEDYWEWRKGSNPVIFPNMMRAGGRGCMQVIVPLDDTHTQVLLYTCYRPDDGQPVPPQQRVPVYEMPLRDADGRFKTDWVTGQDMMVWIMQGALTDRSTEHLAASDRGLIFYRQVLSDQIDAVGAGQDPLGVWRDPATSAFVLLKDESGPPSNMHSMDNHWQQFSPIYAEAKALMLRNRSDQPAEPALNGAAS